MTHNPPFRDVFVGFCYRKKSYRLEQLSKRHQDKRPSPSHSQSAWSAPTHASTRRTSSKKYSGTRLSSTSPHSFASSGCSSGASMSSASTAVHRRCACDPLGLFTIPCFGRHGGKTFQSDFLQDSKHTGFRVQDSQISITV